MINYFRRHLGAKLFLSYLAIILVGATVLGITTAFTAPTAYNRHLGMMTQMTDENGMMGMMEPGNGQGLRRGQGSGFASELYVSFQESLTEALTWAALAAGAAALLVSFFLSRRVVTPVRAMTSASQRIAAGHYDERVQARGADELGQLAHSFNQMATQLQGVEGMRRQLIGDVAHELRTPLTFIKGSMEGLMDGVLPATPETYQQVHQEADRLNRLVNDLQELSRVEAGAYELDFHPVEIVSLVKTVEKRLGSQFKDKHVQLATNLASDLPPIQGDADRLIQVLTNLLTNALRYTPEGGEVTLDASLQGEHIQVAIRDTGVGIPAEHLPHIFTRFYRVDKSRSRQAGGSGIGLTITKHLVEAHGGRIWVESEGEENGSVFTFTLPITE
ncbi:MAG: ATP-binding protein [Anaerolineales bacterium]|jgi:histidine kinase